MAISISKTASLWGIDASTVDVEVDVTIGLGNFQIVGLPDGSVKESKERVQSAIGNMEEGFPIRKIVVNLAPAHIKKSGTNFDLPIALGILEAIGRIPQNCLKNILTFGELSLDGNLRAINGALAMALCAKKAGVKALILPKENAAEASFVKGLEIYPASNITELMDFLNNRLEILPYKGKSFEETQQINIADQIDFSDVKGQIVAKRALEIAAAGKHNILMSGPPGCGKSMLAKSFRGILPHLTEEEAIEVTQVYSVSNLNNTEGLVKTRPYRAPHHSISNAGLIGGGTYPKPGEVSLAHRGVLFLDEFPEFPKSVLDLLRQPLEDKKVTISRANQSTTFPTNFILLAAMNPCPCGYLGDSQNNCTCSYAQIQKYRSRISGPLLDRIDLQIDVTRVPYKDMMNTKETVTSKEIMSSVMTARVIQEERFSKSSTLFNGEMTRKEIEMHCVLGLDEANFMEKAIEKMNFSNRSFDKILKVSRTIADLEKSEMIKVNHIAETLSYRTLEKTINL